MRWVPVHQPVNFRWGCDDYQLITQSFHHSISQWILADHSITPSPVNTSCSFNHSIAPYPGEYQPITQSFHHSIPVNTSWSLNHSITPSRWIPADHSIKSGFRGRKYQLIVSSIPSVVTADDFLCIAAPETPIIGRTRPAAYTSRNLGPNSGVAPTFSLVHWIMMTWEIEGRLILLF